MKDHVFGFWQKLSPTQIKWLVCVVLVLQSSSLVLVLRYCRTASTVLFINSTVVFLGEVLKTAACVGFVLYEAKAGSSWNDRFSVLRQSVFGDMASLLKMSVPSILYAVQNNLLFLALSNLSPAIYQVIYQLKVLTTALFSRVMLKKHISLIQWVSLIMLTIGVAVIQYDVTVPSSPAATSTASDTKAASSLASSSTTSSTQQEQQQQQMKNTTLGLIAVFSACFCSGFAGVFLEKVLKETASTIWVRNVQLGIFGILSGGFLMLWNDGAAIASNGFFHGYTPLVFYVVLNHALGGLVVALVIKHADNIVKGFAMSLSIILCSLASIYLFDFHLSLLFMLGSTTVVASCIIYSNSPAAAGPSASAAGTASASASASTSPTNMGALPLALLSPSSSSSSSSSASASGGAASSPGGGLNGGALLTSFGGGATAAGSGGGTGGGGPLSPYGGLDLSRFNKPISSSSSALMQFLRNDANDDAV